MHVCLSKGWYSHVSEIGLVVPKEVPDGEGASEAIGVAEGGEEQGEPHRPVRKSQVGLSALRSRCKTTVHLATEVLTSWSFRGMLVGMGAVIRPLEQRHALDVSLAKTTRGRRELNLERAEGKHWAHLISTLDAFGESTLQNMGLEAYDERMTVTLLDEAKAEQVAERLVLFWRLVAGKEATLLRHFSVVPPKSFQPLCDRANPEAQEACLERMKVLWTRLEACARAFAGGHLRAELRSLEWPLEQWAREILLSAAENKFQSVPKHITREVEYWCSHMAGSKVVEDLFNECRRWEKETSNGRMDTQSVWLACLQSSVLQDSGLSPVVATAVDRMEGQALPTKACEARLSEEDLSLGPAQMREAFFGKAEQIPRQSIAKHMDVCFGTQALVDAATPEAWARSWLSLLVSPGFVLYSTLDSGCKGYVLEVNKWGCLCWAGEAVGVEDFVWWEFARCARPTFQVAINDPAEWRLLRCVPRLPRWVRQHARLELSSAPRSLVLQLEGSDAPGLLAHAAWNGFRYMTYPHLSLLHSWMTLEGVKHGLVADMVS
jgi:hypothetical protein